MLGPLESGWLVQGPKVREFENKWSSFTGAKHSIAVTSCTSALHLSLAALGFERGDEAIVPAFTWISTANVIEHLGGKVIFCDIDLNTFNIDLDKIEEKITKRTKAILPVHLFGLPVEMDPVLEIAQKHNLLVVEDAACGFGSRYKENHVGTLGNAGCFSFHPRKSITTGEGGMITTNDHLLAEKLQILRDHGASMSDLQRHLGNRPYLLSDHPEAGYNQRMTDIQGALGSSQMDRASQILLERKRLAERYDEAFKDLKWLRIPWREKSFEHAYQSYPCLFGIDPHAPNSVAIANKFRNQWMDNLFKEGISTRPATHAVHMLTYYSKKYRLKPLDFPNAFAADQLSISFPLFNGMRDEEQNHVIDKILQLNPF